MSDIKREDWKVEKNPGSLEEEYIFFLVPLLLSKDFFCVTRTESKSNTHKNKETTQKIVFKNCFAIWRLLLGFKLRIAKVNFDNSEEICAIFLTGSLKFASRFLLTIIHLLNCSWKQLLLVKAVNGVSKSVQK